MKIIVVGCGKIGETLCIDLASEGHDIVLIEQNEKRLNQIIAKADITGFCGNGALHDVQLEAGVQGCDIFISVTPMDETNIIAAITARINGAKMTIARVRDPDYTTQMNFLRSELGIGLMINPELQAARDIAQMLQFPSAINVDQFAAGRAYMVELAVPAESGAIGKNMKEMRARFSNLIFCAILRADGTVIIPSGDTVILEGDHIHITGMVQELNRFYEYLGTKQNRIENALIIGGGKITRYLVPRLIRAGIRVKVIEKIEAIATALVDALPEAEVIIGDGTDQNFLIEEHIEQYDAVIALTGIDEENMLIGLFAEHQNVPKVITKVNRVNLLRIFQSQTQSVVTPKKLVADEIIRLVRALANSQGSNIETMYRMIDSQVEVLQFHVSGRSQCINIPLMDLKTKENILLVYIIRQNELIFPRGQDVILPEDHVILITTHKNFDDLDDILRGG